MLGRCIGVGSISDEQGAFSKKEHPTPLGKAQPRQKAGSPQQKEVPEEDQKSDKYLRHQEVRM